jgi:hypothetical protein
MLCKICGNEHIKFAKGYCCSCYSKTYYTQNSEVLIKKAKERYIRNREALLKQKHEYQTSEHGKRIRREYVKGSEPKLKQRVRHFTQYWMPITPNSICGICGTHDNLIHHHVNYTKNPTDWAIICSSCHLKLHFEPAQAKGKMDYCEKHNVTWLNTVLPGCPKCKKEEPVNGDRSDSNIADKAGDCPMSGHHGIPRINGKVLLPTKGKVKPEKKGGG